MTAGIATFAARAVAPNKERIMDVNEAVRAAKEAKTIATIADVRRIVREEFERCWAMVDSDGVFNSEGRAPGTLPQGGRPVPPAQSNAPGPVFAKPRNEGGERE